MPSRSVMVKGGCDILIVDGPGLIGIEHSLFDDVGANELRRHVWFSLVDINPNPVDSVFKVIGSLDCRPASIVIVGGIRRNPKQSRCLEMLLWGIDDRNENVIINYNPCDRNGSAKIVAELPDFDSWFQAEGVKKPV